MVPVVLIGEERHMRSRIWTWGLTALTVLAASGCRANLGNFFDLW